MTIHEAAEDAVKAWNEIPRTIRDRLGTGLGTQDYALNLKVRMRLLDTAVERVHKLRPGRILEYPAPVDSERGEFEFSGPMTEIPMAEIVVRTDGGPWAVHNQPCAVCGQRTAVLDLSQGVMMPCWPCQELGWDLTRSRPRWWQKRHRSRAGVAE